MLGRVKHAGGRTRAAHPVISDSFCKSLSDSTSENKGNGSDGNVVAGRAASHLGSWVRKGAFGRLTCGVERAFVSVVRPLLQQAEGLSHVIRGPDGRARVTSRLLQEAEGIVGTHHLPAHPFQTPGSREEQRLNKKLDSFDYFLIQKPDLLGSGISVSVIHQFLCVFKAAQHERVVEICSCKIMGVFFNRPEP